MLVVIATIQAKAGKEQEMEDLFKGVIPQVDTESGTLRYVLHRVKKEQGKFLMYEMYRDKEARKAHGETPYFVTLFTNILPLIDGNPSIETFEVIASIKDKVNNVL